MRLSLPAFLIATLGFTTFANAATLTVVSDAVSYGPGSIITLTVVGTIDPTTESATNIDVRLEFTNLYFVNSVADQALNPNPPFGPQTGWTVGGTEGTVSGNSITVFNQIQGLPPGGPFVNNFNGVDSAFVSATVLLVRGAAGLAEVSFGPNTNFFGIGPGPGMSFFIPEPATATLLASGLLAITLRWQG